MKQNQRLVFLLIAALIWLLAQAGEARAEDGGPMLRVDLPTAVARALKENPGLKAKRHEVSLAHGRVQQAELLFQENPLLSVEADYRQRRFAQPTGRATADAEVRLLQEIEIGGQRGHRRIAAAKNLAQTQWSVADAERLLRLEVTQAFYALLSAQEKSEVQQQVLTTQEALLQAGLERFEQGDISVLELDTLRLERDKTRNELVTRQQEQVLAEKQLHVLLGPGMGKLLVAVDDLFSPTTQQAEKESLPSLEELTACALKHRPDVKAAHLNVETQEAELRLAQANRIPNIVLGPVYKLDNEDHVVGGTLTVPLPVFNRNQHEVTTATANLDIARAELEARQLAVRQEVASAYARIQLAAEQRALYEKSYLDNLTHSTAFTRRAYEAGEISIFEFSLAQDRLAQARFRALDAALAYLQAEAELTAQLAFRCTEK